MTVRLLAAQRIGGTVFSAGALVSLSRAEEAGMVQRGVAAWPYSRMAPDGRPRPGIETYAPTFAFLGDSIATYNITDTSVERSFSAFGIASWAMVLSRGGIDFRPEWCFGVSGDRIDQGLARVGDVLAVAPTFCGVLLGTNDVGQNIPQAQMRANMIKLIATLNGAGIIPVVFTLLPRTGVTSAQRFRLLAFNEWLRQTYGSAPGVLLCDPFRSIADPASATSDPVAGDMQDGVHPAQPGAYKAGLALANLLDSIIPNRVTVWPGNADTHDITDNPLGNLVANAGFTTTTTPGTGLTGTTATNWTASRTAGTGSATIAVQARTDGQPGNEIVLTINVSAQSSTEEWKIRQGFVAGASTYSAGDLVFGSCEIDVSASTNLRWCYLYLDDNDGSGVVNTARSLVAASFTMPTVAWSGVMRTPDLIVKPYSGSGTQSLSLGIAVAVNGSSSGVATVKFRAPMARKRIYS